MKIIRDMTEIANLILSKQQYNNKKNYRMLTYTVVIPVDEGKLFHNFLTGQTLLLSNDESNSATQLIDSKILKKLVEYWFFVPIEQDDRQIYDAVFNFTKQFDNEDAIRHFVILPTTECNARCFYCFENGVKRYSMTKQTASQVVNYIMKVSKGKSVKIQWFGGEPLYNKEVIDLISDELRNHNIIFESNMISNGYLFDKKLVTHAKNNWELNRVQITLDGTKDIYNRYKAYIYADDNPFARVINNIKILIEKDILVYLRINLGDHNENDVYKLIDYIYDEIGPSKKLHVYTWLLYETRLSNSMKHTQIQKDDMVRRQIIIENYIENKNLKSIKPITHKIITKSCMAENDSSVIILPSGNITKCDHCNDDDAIGNIFSDKTFDKDVIKSWKNKRSEINRCKTCKVFTHCRWSAKCPEFGNQICSEADQEFKIDNLCRAVKELYKQYKMTVNE